MHRTLNSSHPLRYSPFNAKTVFNQSLLVRMRLVFPIVSALAWLIHQLVQPTLPKPSYSPAVNPAAILNPNAPPRPQKSFLDAVAGSAAPWVPVKPVLLHRGEPIAHFLPRKCRLWLNLSNWHLLLLVHFCVRGGEVIRVITMRGGGRCGSIEGCDRLW